MDTGDLNCMAASVEQGWKLQSDGALSVEYNFLEIPVALLDIEAVSQSEAKSQVRNFHAQRYLSDVE